MNGVSVTLTELPDAAGLEAEWRDLEARADGSFFLSWTWIGNWLAFLPADAAPMLLRGRAGGRTVALAVLVPGRRPLQRLRQLWLHETGSPDYDRLAIEYNGILVDRDAAGSALPACLRHLMDGMGPLSEVRLSGLPEPFMLAVRRAATEAGRGFAAMEPVPTYGIDLRALRGSGTGYLASLGSNTRYSIRQAMRQCGQHGPLAIRHAGTAAEALEWFEDLKRLHEARWHALGQPGAFAPEPLAAFNRRLIETGVPAGAVRLSRITAGDLTVGHLHNFVWRGRVLAYQGGFGYSADNRMRPGMVCHCLAAEDSLARGEDYYDFMAGDSAYKARMGSPGVFLHNVRLLPGVAVSWVYERLRHAKSLLRPAPPVARAGDA